MLPGGSRIVCMIKLNFLGLDLYYTDSARHFMTAGCGPTDIFDLSDDLSYLFDLTVLSVLSDISDLSDLSDLCDPSDMSDLFDLSDLFDRYVQCKISSTSRLTVFFRY